MPPLKDYPTIETYTGVRRWVWTTLKAVITVICVVGILLLVWILRKVMRGGSDSGINGTINEGMSDSISTLDLSTTRPQ